ncbi:MAG: hypothetical protein K8R52_04100 [Bacteroidales bacterium]|nr:hypothetical protein [Bacteroidales bacterium]
MIRSSRWFNLFRMVVYTGIASVSFLSCSSSDKGVVVAVELQDTPDGSFEGAKLITIDIQKPGKPAKILSAGFESAAAPAISHQGRYLFFQGKKEGDQLWQIWVTDLQKRSTNRVTDLPENCIEPTPLPDGTVMFSREGTIKGKKVHDLYRCQMDGTELRRITFNPAHNLSATVLQEGRVLYSSSQQYPDSKTPVLMVMRPDGTKSEIYYWGAGESAPSGGGAESEDGYIYFIESGGQLSRVLHKRPLHTMERLSDALPGSFSSVYPIEGSNSLVSYRPSDNEPFALYIFDANTKDALHLLYKGTGHVTDPLLMASIEKRPRILPSPVELNNPTAILMSQDINHSMIPVNSGIKGDSAANRIRVSTLEGELAIVEVKADGSFYLKLDADIPVRIETLNSQGEIVRGPSDWIYLRANERRACVGCHANPELAPKNIQPLAVKEDHVVLIAEKKETSH